MSVIHCDHCDEDIDLDRDVDHVAECGPRLTENDEVIAAIRSYLSQTGFTKPTGSVCDWMTDYIAELEKDKARLDWLQRNSGGAGEYCQAVTDPAGIWWLIHDDDNKTAWAYTFREAIDAAMEGTP